MPILLNVLGSSDQKVVEQGSLCVSRVVDSFKFQQGKLEELVQPELLKAILRLLLPGTTNLIGPNIHTQFLRVLAIVARASPSLATELLKMDVVDTIYQILTGVSPPSGSDVASEIDGVVIMQALIHRPREHIYEALNVICELLPGVTTDGLSMQDELFEAGYNEDELTAIAHSRAKRSPNAKRIELLKGCQTELKRFATILLPTLTHAYSSTVNLNVRQKVLTAQLKMLSNLDVHILESALRTVPYASYLTSILSQQDHPSLVISALQAAELLLLRLESIYRYQFYREGVFAEISKLANQPEFSTTGKDEIVRVESAVGSRPQHLVRMEVEEPLDEKTNGTERSGDPQVPEADQPDEDDLEDDDDHDEEGDDDDDEGDDDDEPHDIHDVISPSPSFSSSSERHYIAPTPASGLQGYVVVRAKRILDIHEDAKGRLMRDKATGILSDVKELAKDIRNCYLNDHIGNGLELFQRLSYYFSSDTLESMTSAELLNSEIIDVLLDVFGGSNGKWGLFGLLNRIHLLSLIGSQYNEARSAFLQVFMGTTLKNQDTSNGGKNPSTPFSVLVHKLQDLLSRAEHFEVVTVHQNSFDSNRSSAASMLAKQLRLKLVADENSEIPHNYRNIMVSIHAIATFKALDDYLRPRISHSPDRPRAGRHHEGVSNALAAFAAAAGISSSHQRLIDRGLLHSGDTPSLPPPVGTATGTKNNRKPSRSKSALTTNAAVSETPVTGERPATARRSSRRHQLKPPVQAAVNEPRSDQGKEPLECADERPLSDDENMDDHNALEAFVDDLEDEMESASLPDPSAVNLEVAATGGITAREEDGTRVPTPSQASSTPAIQATPPSRIRSAIAPGAMTGRAMSYAAAVQAVPQNWHIQFSIDDQPIPNETTIYRAVHYNRSQPDEPALRNVWSAIHPIKFKRVEGPPSIESSVPMPSLDSMGDAPDSGLPLSLHKHPATSKILRLLNILHELNANLDVVLDEKQHNIKMNAEPLTQFVNTKLTAKLNRQLEEPLIVASNCLPSWSEDLARLYPFLFPFETRHLFVQSTSFGYSRSMSRWQNAQATDDTRRDRLRDERPFLGRLQRQKVRIARTRILESALKVMELYGASPSVLEVEYFEEVGTGLGPTLEFYSTVSKEFSKKKIKLWRENESNPMDEYAFGKLGLFPAPMSAEQTETDNGKKILHLFKMLGKFVGRSMLDSRIIDVSFNPTFFKIGDRPSAVPLSLATVRTVDVDLANSLKLLQQFAQLKKTVDENNYLSAAQKVQASRQIRINGTDVEDLGLDFTLPGYPVIELIGNGANIPVTIDNVAIYVDKVVDLTLGSGVQRQMEAFKAGFSQVFPYSALRAFTPSELVMLFGRVEEDWTIESESFETSIFLKPLTKEFI